MQEQVDAERMDLGQEATQVLQAAAEPINRPSHNDLKLPLGGVVQQCIKLRAPVSALGARDAVVAVDLDDLEPAAAGDLAELAFLIGRGLVEGAHSQVNGSALHRPALSGWCR